MLIFCNLKSVDYFICASPSFPTPINNALPPTWGAPSPPPPEKKNKNVPEIDPFLLSFIQPVSIQ